MLYVTAFYDLNREHWNNPFKRSVSTYISAFKRLVKFIPNVVVYMDKRHLSKISSENAEIIPIDEEWLNRFCPNWKELKTDTQIVESDTFRQKVAHRNHPEVTMAEYSLINHAKIDFVCHAIQLKPNHERYAWIDFGYFSGDHIPLPPPQLDFNKIPIDKVTLAQLHPLEDNDFDMSYTLKFAPERIGGFFFCGGATVLLYHQQIYRHVHKCFQKAGIVDDDQHALLQCIKMNKNIYNLVSCGWHTILSELALPSLDDLMKTAGSDKFGHHHNYTRLYKLLFEDKRHQPINLLEIGIGSVNPDIISNMCGNPNYKTGSSLRGWRDYFSKGQIMGCDIDNDTLFSEQRIQTFQADQRYPQTFKLPLMSKQFDIIIDDGLHHFQTNLNVLQSLKSYLKSGGIYVIEDIVDFDETLFNRHGEHLDGVWLFTRLYHPRNQVDNNVCVFIKN